MPRTGKTRLLPLIARAAFLVLRLTLMYARLRIRLASWKAYNSLTFKVKTMRLPAELRRDLRREYSETLRSISIPIPSPTPRRPRQSRGGGNG